MPTSDTTTPPALARRRRHEVPRLHGEFASITITTPEWAEARR